MSTDLDYYFKFGTTREQILAQSKSDIERGLVQITRLPDDELLNDQNLLACIEAGMSKDAICKKLHCSGETLERRLKRLDRPVVQVHKDQKVEEVTVMDGIEFPVGMDLNEESLRAAILAGKTQKQCAEIFQVKMNTIVHCKRVWGLLGLSPNHGGEYYRKEAGLPTKPTSAPVIAPKPMSEPEPQTSGSREEEHIWSKVQAQAPAEPGEPQDHESALVAAATKVMEKYQSALAGIDQRIADLNEQIKSAASERLAIDTKLSAITEMLEQFGKQEVAPCR